MSDLIKIAVDAMGGDGSPKKVIDGIIFNHSKNKNNFFKIFGDKNKIKTLIDGKVSTDFFEIIHTDKKIESTDSPLEGAKEAKIQVCGLQSKVLGKSRYCYFCWQYWSIIGCI